MKPHEFKILLGSGGIILLIIGFCVAMVGRGEAFIASHASPEPHTLTLQEFIANGPGNNWHVRVTSFAFGQGYVDEMGGSGDVWIPVYPTSGVEGQEPPQAPAGPFSVLIRTHKPRGDVARYCETTTVIQGVVSANGGLRSWTTIGSELLEMYPGTDLEHCRMIDEDVKPWSASSIRAVSDVGLALLASGAALILVLVALIIRDRRAAAAARAWG